MEATIIEFILVLISHAVAGIYSSTLKYSRKYTYTIWGIWIGIQSTLFYYTEFVLTNQVLQFLVGFVLSMVGQYVIFLVTTKGKLVQRVFTMLTYSILFCIFMSLFTMVKGTFQNLHNLIILFIEAVMLFCVLHYFLRYVCPLCRIAAKNITNSWRHLNFVNAVFLAILIVSSVFPIRLTNFHDSSAIAFIFLSIAIMAAYPVIFSNINSMSEVAMKREVERQNELLLAQIEMENMLRIADRQFRHDRRHHNLVMLELAEAGEFEQVREYLKNLVQSETEVGGDVKHCENMTINTVLTVYERRAKEEGIAVNISVHVSPDLAVQTPDLVIIIANLFENAIHATVKRKNKSRFIDISIKESAQRLLVKVENPCSANLVFGEEQYGIGISSMITTTSKYDGMYDFSVEDGIFSAKICLNLK